MKIEKDMTPLLSDINGQAVVAGSRPFYRNYGQLGDAVRNVDTGKVFRVASVNKGVVRLVNANGSKPSKACERSCLVAHFSSKFEFDCAAW